MKCLSLFLLFSLFQSATSFSAAPQTKSVDKSSQKIDLQTYLQSKKKQRIKSREYCSGCNRPHIQCLCDHIPQEKIVLETEVLVLQHPVEFRRKTVSTVPLLKLTLDKCNVMVGRSFDTQLEAVIDDACKRGLLPLLLFPAEDAITLEDSDASSRLNQLKQEMHVDKSLQDPNSKYLLIIVDGTWTQAKRMVRYSPILVEKCHPIQFMGTDDRSIYDSIRKQPESFCLSTLESCARTLQLLEADSTNMHIAVNHLHASLRALVKTQMAQEQVSLENSPESIRNVTKLEMKRMRQQELDAKVNMEEVIEKGNFNDDLVVGLDDVQDIGNGYRLRALVGRNDAEYVDSIWPYSSSRSLRMIERQIENDNKNATVIGSSCCLGIEYDNRLVGCIIRHRNGSLGILHVDEEHRRKGLAAVLLDVASRAVMDRKEQLFAFIVDGNYQSEALFSKMGWSKIDTSKKGTGKRKAKRLWMKKYLKKTK